MRRLRRRLGQERGVVLVEFAVVLPVLLLIILGILYFGRYENYSNQETQLAEEAVRFAAVDFKPPSGSLQDYVRSQAQPELQSGSSDVTKAAQVFIYFPTNSSNAVGNPVRACVVATVTYPTPIGSPTSTIAQVATMRLEQLQTSNWSPDTTAAASAAGCPIS